MTASDATLNPTPAHLPPPGVELASAQVNLEGLSPVLVQFLRTLGLIHLSLFGTTAVITSAVDSVHVASSKHGKGQAVDLRTHDKDGRSVSTYIAVLGQLSMRYRLAVFDETQLQGQEHIHVEIAG